MFLGSRKFLGMGRFASITAQATFAGSTGSGITSIGVGFETALDSLIDPSNHFDGFVLPAGDVDYPTVNFLTAGRTLTVDIVSCQVQYSGPDDDGPSGGLYDEVNVKLYYGKLGDVFNSPIPTDVQNQITITSTATPTYTGGGSRTYTNNFSTYNVAIQELAYNQNNQSTYPIRWITRKTIPTTDKSASTGPITGLGLFAVYNVVGRGSPTAGSIIVNVREGSA